MRRSTTVVATAAVVASTLSLGWAATAAEEASPEIAWVKNNVVVKGNNPDQATIMAKYRCVGDGVHL